MIDTETWSYTILGNSTATKIHGAFHDIIIASLPSEELENLDKILANGEYINSLIEKNYDLLVSYAFKTESRLGFQALGVFLMGYGAKITNSLKILILKHSKWMDEKKQLQNKYDRTERKKYLFDFREKILRYDNREKVKVADETVTHVLENKEIKSNDTLPWRQSINHKIEDLEDDLKIYFKIDKTEFKLNKYIILKLEGGKTFIYIKNKKFILCSHVFIDIPELKLRNEGEDKSIDEYIENYYITSPYNSIEDFPYLPLNLEFWVHCSNMQVWVENNYNSKLLHSNLSFPLLKKLTEVGDPAAKKIFKEEIAKRFESGYIPVMNYLIEMKYLRFLDNNEKYYLKHCLEDLIEKAEDPKKINEYLRMKKKILF